MSNFSNIELLGVYILGGSAMIILCLSLCADHISNAIKGLPGWKDSGKEDEEVEEYEEK